MITTIFIVVSAVLYIFFKVKYFQAKAPIEKKLISTKGNIAIGVFLVSFGLNQIVIATTVALVIGVIFIGLGTANVFFGYKAYKHYFPLMMQEANGKS
ncbi:YtpI family protein [Anaerobacillus isosaccharinicus]|uniref:YtpI family protein n=1 Tax=Anaerobacillus isosaccharinicus TaxID=1532552 RepID=A0A1S2LV68_9BACI|nr:YtpI family protein [Anaerobacillus isosaccharinicus]MBA5587947.1 YtpI family protein [Anaerobacillus isosaccharinicus]QOY33904.1 YtpI family protein [Anaerobacillus isosaccharinicus]